MTAEPRDGTGWLGRGVSFEGCTALEDCADTQSSTYVSKPLARRRVAGKIEVRPPPRGGSGTGLRFPALSVTSCTVASRGWVHCAGENGLELALCRDGGKRNDRRTTSWKRKKTGMRNRIVIGWLLGGALVGLQAGTVYVDVNFGPNGDGSTNAPYNTIQAALDNLEADTIIVYPGTYKEHLRIQRSVHLMGYDGPHTTIIDATDDNSEVALRIIVVVPNMRVQVEGLWFIGGETGVYFYGITPDDRSSRFLLNNCIATGARNDGIYVKRHLSDFRPRVTIQNCVSAGNGRDGLAATSDPCSDNAANCAIRNSIGYANGRYGLSRSGNWTYEAEYNVANSNSVGNFAQTESPSNLTIDPGFVDGKPPGMFTDFRLSSGSLCRNRGSLGVTSLNPDGSRNDMGAFGGPGARKFPDGVGQGPIVRELSVSKGVVPKGETVTIRAKAAVR